MYLVTGANLFGQWFPCSQDINIFEKFEALSIDIDDNIDLTRAKLVSCSWAYNIFEIDDTFYVAGAWHGKDNQLVKAPIFKEPKHDSKDTNILIAGNDYMLVYVEKIERIVWFYNLEFEEFKKVYFVEEPLEEDTAKKLKATDDIIKVSVKNNNFIYLSSEGNVYIGQMPTYVDTRHCIGKVCDVECGYEHYMILTNEGRVYTWGNGRYT